MKKLIITSLLFSCQLFFAQSNIETILKSGELIISGLSKIKDLLGIEKGSDEDILKEFRVLGLL